MEPLFEIQNGLGKEDHSLKVYPDRILIRKPKVSAFGIHGALGIIKKELRIQYGIGCEYIGIDIPFSVVDSIYYREATSPILKNGLLVFYLKGRGKNEVNALNYDKSSNAIKFWSQDNETALAIKTFIEKETR